MWGFLRAIWNTKIRHNAKNFYEWNSKTSDIVPRLMEEKVAAIFDRYQVTRDEAFPCKVFSHLKLQQKVYPYRVQLWYRCGT